MKRVISIVALSLTLCCAAFAAGKPSGNSGNFRVTPQQIRQHSMAANKQRTWEANRTNRQLYRMEKFKNGRLSALELIPWRMRRPSNGWYYSLFRQEKPVSSISAIVLSYLEKATQNIDITKPLPSVIEFDPNLVKPIKTMEYLQVEAMPSGGVWLLSDVWYKAEEPDAIEIVNLEGNERGILFKKPGAVRLRAFALEKGTVYSWKAFINVETKGTAELPNVLTASENTASTPVSGGTQK